MTITLSVWIALPAIWAIGLFLFITYACWFDGFSRDGLGLWVVFGLIPALLMVLTRMLP